MDKRFLVVKIEKEIGPELSVIPVPGLFDRDRAEEVLRELHDAEPNSVFLIQEVGAA